MSELIRNERTEYEWNVLFSQKGMELLMDLDATVINGLGTLIYNIGPETKDIGIEDVVCRDSFSLEQGEPLPDSVFEALALIGKSRPLIDIEASAPLEAQWFVCGLNQTVCEEPKTDLLSKYVDALSRQRLGSASREDLEILETRRREVLEILEMIFGQYTSEADAALVTNTAEFNRLQYLIYPVERRFQQLLQGFDPDVEEAA